VSNLHLGGCQERRPLVCRRPRHWGRGPRAKLGISPTLLTNHHNNSFGGWRPHFERNLPSLSTNPQKLLRRIRNETWAFRKDAANFMRVRWNGDLSWGLITLEPSLMRYLSLTALTCWPIQSRRFFLATFVLGPSVHRIFVHFATCNMVMWIQRLFVCVQEQNMMR